MRRLWLWVPVLALLLTGCGGEPSRGVAWTELTYHMTGGIAGFDRKVALSADGAFTVTERGRSPVKGKLSSGDLKRLKATIDAVPWRDLQPTYIDPKVADAILENIKILTPDKDFSVQVGTGGSPPAELNDLLKQLKAVGK